MVYNIIVESVSQDDVINKEVIGELRFEPNNETLETLLKDYVEKNLNHLRNNGFVFSIRLDINK